MSYVNLVEKMEKKAYLKPSLILRGVNMESLLAGLSMEVHTGSELIVEDDDQVFSKDMEQSDIWED